MAHRQAECAIRIAAPESLGLDVWSDFAGMAEHYTDSIHIGDWPMRLPAGLRRVFGSSRTAIGRSGSRKLAA